MQSSLGNVVLRQPVTILNSGSKLVAYYLHHKASPSLILLYRKHLRQRESSSRLLPDVKTLLVAHQVIWRLGASPTWTLLQVSWKTPEHSLWRKLNSSPNKWSCLCPESSVCVPLLCLILSKSIFLFRISHKDKSEICASFSRLLHLCIAWTQIFLGGIIIFNSRAVTWDEHDKYRTRFYLQSEGNGRRKNTSLRSQIHIYTSYCDKLKWKHHFFLIGIFSPTVNM